MPSLASSQRYRGITLLLGLIAVCEIVLLSVSIYFSQKLEQQGISAQIAAQQIQIVQQLRSTLKSVDPNSLSDQQRKSGTEELQFSLSRIDVSLSSFQQGGTLAGPLGTPVAVSPLTTPSTLEALAETQNTWGKIKEQVVQILFSLNQKEGAEQTFTGTRGFALDKSVQLQDSMRNLAEILNEQHASTETLVSALFYLMFAVAIIGVLLTLYVFVPRLRKEDDAQQQVADQSIELFHHLNEAVVVVDRQQRIGKDYSKEAERIFNDNTLASRHLYELLRSIVSPDTVNQINQHLATLFDPSKHEPFITDINPAKSITAELTDASGNTQSRQLRFNFQRLYENDRIKHIMVSILDITSEKQLEERLLRSQQQNSDLLEAQTELLRANEGELKMFAETVQPSLTRVESLLRKLANEEEDLESSLFKTSQELGKELQNLSHASGSLEYFAFYYQLEAFQEDLQDLGSKEHLEHIDFQPMFTRLERLSAYAQSIVQIAKRLEEGSKDFRTQDQWAHLKSFANDIADRHEKVVKTVTSGLNEKALTPDTQSLITDISQQLIRQALTHSIESPEQRSATRKPESGRLDIILSEVDAGELELNIRDDGAGINFDTIKDQALQRDIAPASELKKWSNRKLFNLTLSPDFWSPISEDTDKEHRSGMQDILQRIKDSNGTIEVSTRPGRYTQYSIHLPVMDNMDTQQTLQANEQITSS